MGLSKALECVHTTDLQLDYITAYMSKYGGISSQHILVYGSNLEIFQPDMPPYYCVFYINVVLSGIVSKFIF